MLLLALTLSLLSGVAEAATRPHIVLVIADDLGWMDVGWRDPDMATPTLDRLVSEGVNLTSHYVQPLCSPSRAALLSGLYPFRLGMQNTVLDSMNNASLPLGLTLLPERMQDLLSYSTHLVGKWHLGFCDWEMTPTYRGFDSFYGFYLGKSDYYTRLGFKDGFDLHHNADVLWNETGTYSTELYTNRAIQILEEHDPEADPLFLVLSYQAVHSPLDAPKRYIDQFCSHVTDPDRQMHCAMTAAMDEGIGNLTDALTNLGYDDNLLLLFTTDNGGPVTLGSSNWPLRGSKGSLWEGGVRATSFLHSKTLLPDAPYTWDGLIHAVDWYPTLLEAAGDKSGVSGIDGESLWTRIVNNGRSTRTELVYNMNEVKDTAAIRQGKFKLIYGNPGSADGWYNPPSGQTALAGPAGKSPTYQLFDINNDPEETTDVSNKNMVTKQAVIDMTARLTELWGELHPAEEGVTFPSANPANYGGAWYPGWC